MIQIQGTLNIKTIGGRNGDFNVGTLTSDVGEFSVKSSELDQYDQGSYDGTFGIAHIGLGYFNWGEGKHVTELKATLGFIAINGIDDLPDDYTSIGEVEPETPSTDKPDQVDKQVADSDEPGEQLDDELFNPAIVAAIENCEPVQLDPTVGRPKFPNQIAALKERGYKYDVNAKTWRPER